MIKAFASLGWDLGAPVAVYYALHLAGFDDWAALLGAAACALLRVLVVAVRRRQLDYFACVMLLVYSIGLALALLTGDPRTLLLRNSFITASVGVIFLVTAFGTRPLTLTALQSVAPAHADVMARRFKRDPVASHGFRVASVVWGVGLLTEAAVRIPLVFTLRISVAEGVTEAMFAGAMLLLGGWTVWYVHGQREHIFVDFGEEAANWPGGQPGVVEPVHR